MVIFLTLCLRWLVVLLFFPFSALDKIINFKGAVKQAQELFPARGPATLMILAGLMVEIFCSLGVITGIADRAAALILALYCIATAVLFKRFWQPGDFWKRGDSLGRNIFWDFLKNLSLAGGIMLVTFGSAGFNPQAFLANPLGSTHPYAQHNVNGAL